MFPARSRRAAKAVPYALLILGGYGLVLAKYYHDGNITSYLYGLVLAGAHSWRTHLVLAQAAVFFAAGLWLLVRVEAPGARRVRTIIARWRSSARRGSLPAQGWLLPPIAVLAIELLSARDWFGAQWTSFPRAVTADAVVATLSLVLVFRSRVWAATLAEAGLLVLGAYGLLITAFWPAVPGFVYGLVPLNAPRAVLGVGLQGTALLALGLWLAPRVMREYRGVPADLELAERASQLTQRVQTLTQTRSDAVDTAAAELRRIERDLHDGAQARLVALGMSLQRRRAELRQQPGRGPRAGRRGQGVLRLALAELRDLVRGIYPPVLADRGLGEAIRALALDTPLRTVVDIDLPQEVQCRWRRPPTSRSPRRSTKSSSTPGHPCAITAQHLAGMLHIEVTDDGSGGADPAHGTGLRGVERRLATFDGILEVSSPPGGPTILAMVVPCASSSPKTSLLRDGPGQAAQAPRVRDRRGGGQRPELLRALADTAPTWGSSMCGCRRRSPMKGYAPRSRHAPATRPAGTRALAVRRAAVRPRAAG